MAQSLNDGVTVTVTNENTITGSDAVTGGKFTSQTVSNITNNADPKIQSVAIDEADGMKVSGNTITFTVKFTEKVFVSEFLNCYWIRVKQVAVQPIHQVQVRTP